MHTSITIELGERSYPVITGSHLLAHADALLEPYIKGKQVCIVSNETVAPLYLEGLLACLTKKYQVISHILPDGERYKNLETLSGIFETLLANKCNRDVTLLALGGGVVGDMTGFAAASFMRGVNFIQIPTTLLAQVDSSVGGKTGVNHALGKNMIGAFYQPKCVLADVDTLGTLPERELSAGIAEVIKYALIIKPEFFPWLESNMTALLDKNPQALTHAIQTSCECKAYVVGQDENETGLRAILNLGHTFGHALEAHYQYKVLLHGEAVAIGMCMAVKLSSLQGKISEQEVKRIEHLISAAQLPTRTPDVIELEKLLPYMKVDKKAQSGKVRLVTLARLGQAEIIDTFDMHQLEQSIKAYMP